MIDELRSLKQQALVEGDYLTVLQYAELDGVTNNNLHNIDFQRLSYLLKSARLLSEQRSVPGSLLKKALTPDEFSAYNASFDVDISHVESAYESDEVPEVLLRYSDLLSRADKLSQLATMHRGRSRKRDNKGLTAGQRFEYQAEHIYEIALMELIAVLDTSTNRNPHSNHHLATEVTQWLDREVSTEPGYQPALNIEAMPRVRGSKSKYCLKSEPVVGLRKRRYWRDFTAVTEAALRYLDMK